MSASRRLVSWFRANVRPLPWRTTPRDPYRSLVSEFMAQQTQIDRVAPRFEAFIERFPGLADIAAASEDEVVEAWSGLGYYRRARLLHRLAREVVAGSGELPRSAAELERLPGVGPYTAAAVASMVFGEAAPLVDGNVARVGVRVLALAGDPRRGEVRTMILNWVEGLMAEADPSEINEGLMELGALVCTPAGPACDICPLATGCGAAAAGHSEDFPAPRKVRKPVDLHWVSAIAEDGDGHWLFRRVTDGPILRGLWLPPFAEIDPSRPVVPQAAAVLPLDLDGPPEVREPLKHSITHRRIRVVPVRFPVARRSSMGAEWEWADPHEPRLPTSSLLGKLVAAVSGPSRS
jgi:A/G-specific adenine glycosylase